MYTGDTQLVAFQCPHLGLHGRHSLSGRNHRADNFDFAASRYWSVEHNVQRSTDAHVVPETRSSHSEQCCRAEVIEHRRSCATMYVSVFVAQRCRHDHVIDNFLPILGMRDKLDLLKRVSLESIVLCWCHQRLKICLYAFGNCQIEVHGPVRIDSHCDYDENQNLLLPEMLIDQEEALSGFWWNVSTSTFKRTTENGFRAPGARHPRCP